MSETINDLYLKYAEGIGESLESDRYFQYLFEMVQAGENTLQQKNRILHTFVIEPYRNQKGIPQKVKNAVVTDCHEKSGKILILIGIEQSRRKNRSRNVCPGTFAFFCGWYRLKEGVF